MSINKEGYLKELKAEREAIMKRLVQINAIIRSIEAFESGQRRRPGRPPGSKNKRNKTPQVAVSPTGAPNLLV